MDTDFIKLCETLWREWLALSLEVSPFVTATFDLNATPEPYLSFNAGQQPLVALTTNPGATMAVQVREAVHRGDGPLNTSLNFATAARILGSFYEQALPSKSPARHRIDKLSHLSQLLGADGVLQVEVCPFHSPLLSMSKKHKLLREVEEGGFLARSVESLRRFTTPHPVFVVSAVSSQSSLQSGLEMSRWLTWQATIAGVHLDTAAFIPQVTKGPKTTCGAFVTSVAGTPKALVLMMGTNNLPGLGALETLAHRLRSSAK